MLTLTITATTTDATLENTIPFLDMLSHAREMRDTAAAMIEEHGDQEVLDLHEIDGVTVLYSFAFGYAFANARSYGIGNSLFIGWGECESPEQAVDAWNAA